MGRMKGLGRAKGLGRMKGLGESEGVGENEGGADVPHGMFARVTIMRSDLKVIAVPPLIVELVAGRQHDLRTPCRPVLEDHLEGQLRVRLVDRVATDLV